MGVDSASVGAEVVRRRVAGERVAGYVGRDEAMARTLGEEMLGGLDEVVDLPGP